MSGGAPGCVAVRECRGFEDTEDVGDIVGMTGDAESLPLTLVCGVGRVDEGEARGEADMMGTQESVVYCRYRMVSRIIRERGDRVNHGREQKTPDQTPPEGVSHAGWHYAQ